MSYERPGRPENAFIARLRRTVRMVLVLLALAIVSRYPALGQDGVGPVRVTDVAVLSNHMVRLTYETGDEVTSLDVPAEILAQIVQRLDAARVIDPPVDGASADPAAPPTGNRGPRKVGTVRAHSAVTGQEYHVTIVADSIATIRFQQAGVANAVSLPADLFPLLEAHNRALAGRLQDTEAQFWLDQETGRVHLGFIRGFDYRWLLALFAIIVGVMMTVLVRISVWRVKRERDELLASRRSMAQIREAERSHLASELHDGPIQDLQRILRSHVGQLSHLAPDQQQATLHEIENDLKGVAGSLRNVCSDLKPPVLVHFGLARALESFSREFMVRNPNTKIDFKAEPDADRLSMETRLVVYRIFQEALTNIEKHANASRVDVRLRRVGEGVQLSIRDNGEGFKVPSRLIRLEQAGHFGLSGMRHRAQGLGGRLDVSSRVGEGTHVLVSVPYRRAEDEELTAVAEEQL